VTPRIITPESDAQWDAYLECRYQCLYAPYELPHTCTTSELDSPRLRDGVLHRSVIDDSGRVMACGRLDIQLEHPAGPSAQLRYFGVAPESRGTGVGQMLVRHLEDEARRAGCRRLWMEARVAALNFYMRQGYEDIGDGPLKWGLIPHRLLARAL